MVFLKDFFFQKVDFVKHQQTTKKHAKLPSRQRVKRTKSLTYVIECAPRTTLSTMWPYLATGWFHILQWNGCHWSPTLVVISTGRRGPITHIHHICFVLYLRPSLDRFARRWWLLHVLVLVVSTKSRAWSGSELCDTNDIAEWFFEEKMFW